MNISVRSLVEQAQMVKQTNDNKINSISRAGVKAVRLYCQATGNAPTADSGIFINGVEEWRAGTSYEQNDLFSYEGNMGYVKQPHTAQEQQKPFTAGTEALYGARPAPDENGVYPYTYNMACDVGMKVRDGEEIYECVQAIADMLYAPHETLAHFKLVE